MATKKLLVGMTILMFFFVMLLMVSQVSAYRRLCLTKGQAIPSKQNPRYECSHDQCQVCVTDSNYPTDPFYCKDLTTCNLFGGNDGDGGLDQNPPTMTITSPVDNNVYNSRSVMFDIKTNELSTIYYTDNVNGRGKWSRIAAGVTAFKKGVSFKDGKNNISIKAVDTNGNPVIITKVFYVDSQKPKITKTLPSKDFASGKFDVLFTEENPKSLVLDYGNGVKGRKTQIVDLSTCINAAGKYSCSINVNLNDYSNQNIDYKFRLTDIANSIVESKPVALKVDATKPIINNPSTMINVNGKYVTFNISINEPNLLSVEYLDNTDLKPMWKKLCSSLSNGYCFKKTTLKNGEHIMDIRIKDKAGNELVKRTIFTISY